MMSGSKAPDFDAHIGAGSKVFHPLMSKLMWVKDLLTLASLYPPRALWSAYLRRYYFFQKGHFS